MSLYEAVLARVRERRERNGPAEVFGLVPRPRCASCGVRAILPDEANARRAPAALRRVLVDVACPTCDRAAWWIDGELVARGSGPDADELRARLPVHEAVDALAAVVRDAGQRGPQHVLPALARWILAQRDHLRAIRFVERVVHSHSAVKRFAPLVEALLAAG